MLSNRTPLNLTITFGARLSRCSVRSGRFLTSRPGGVIDVWDGEPAVADTFLFDPSDSRKIHVVEGHEVPTLGGVSERLLASCRCRLLVDIERDGDGGIFELPSGAWMVSPMKTSVCPPSSRA